MEVMQAQLTAIEPNDWPRSLLLTVLNILFNLIFITVLSSDSFTLSFSFLLCHGTQLTWLTTVLFGPNIAWNSSDCFGSFSPLNNIWIVRPLMLSSDVTHYPKTWKWFWLVDCLNICIITGADLGGGCRGCAHPLPPRVNLRFSNTTGILQKKKKRSNCVVYWCWSRARDECTRS